MVCEVFFCGRLRPSSEVQADGESIRVKEGNVSQLKELTWMEPQPEPFLLPFVLFSQEPVWKHTKIHSGLCDFCPHQTSGREGMKEIEAFRVILYHNGKLRLYQSFHLATHVQPMTNMTFRLASIEVYLLIRLSYATDSGCLINNLQSGWTLRVSCNNGDENLEKQLWSYLQT